MLEGTSFFLMLTSSLLLILRARKRKKDLLRRVFIKGESRVGIVREIQRITPGDYARNVVHIEIESDISYSSGDALGVYGQTSEDKVRELLKIFLLDKNTSVEEKMSLYEFLRYVADLKGRLTKKFFYRLKDFAVGKYYRLKFHHLGTDDNELFKVFIRRGETPYSILLQFREHLKIPSEDFATLFTKTKVRFYSISSCKEYVGNRVHLLVAEESWTNSEGKMKVGQCSSFLCGLEVGDVLKIFVKSFELKMPSELESPMIMVGLGTGVAPFRAFIQEEKLHRFGKELSLFYGARHRKSEYFYGKDFESYKDLDLNLAFSRDQQKKIYVQELLFKKKDYVRENLLEKKGVFYLCGSKSSSKDIENLMGEIGVDIQGLREDGRYLREVY